MPKAKTHKATMKRVKITATGKVKHKRRGTSHRNSNNTGKESRHLRQDTTCPREVTKVLERRLGMKLTPGK